MCIFWLLHPLARPLYTACTQTHWQAALQAFVFSQHNAQRTPSGKRALRVESARDARRLLSPAGELLDSLIVVLLVVFWPRVDVGDDCLSHNKPFWNSGHDKTHQRRLPAEKTQQRPSATETQGCALGAEETENIQAHIVRSPGFFCAGRGHGCADLHFVFEPEKRFFTENNMCASCRLPLQFEDDVPTFLLHLIEASAKVDPVACRRPVEHADRVHRIAVGTQGRSNALRAPLAGTTPCAPLSSSMSLA